MMLIPIEIPQTVRSFFAKMFEIIKFDLFEDLFRFDGILEWIFGFEDEPVDDQVDSLGYGSQFIITNLGSVFVIFVITFGLQFWFFLIARYGSCCMGNENALMKFAKN